MREYELYMHILVWLLQLTIFSVMDKLPATSYVRLVDIWLIMGQLVPFIEVSIVVKPESKAQPKSNKVPKRRKEKGIWTQG